MEADSDSMMDCPHDDVTTMGMLPFLCLSIRL